MRANYSEDETLLIIKLRAEGFIGRRLYDQFNDVYPGRTWKAIRGKIERIREKGHIRR